MNNADQTRYRARCRAIDLVRKHRPELIEAMHYAVSKHPQPYRSHFQALCVLLEEVAEVVWALLRRDWQNLAEELCHVEVVCVRWREFAQVGSGRTEEGEGDPTDDVMFSARQGAIVGKTEAHVFVKEQA